MFPLFSPEEKIIRQIERLVQEHESTAEEYFQEIGDEDKGNECLAKAAALKEVLDWIKEQRKIRRNKNATGNLKTKDTL